MSTPDAGFRRSPSGRTVVVAPRGELDVSTVPALLEGLGRAHASSARAVVVDLQAVPTLEATAVAALVDAHRALQAVGRDLVVINVLPRAVQALDLLDQERELRVVALERLLSPAWQEPGAMPVPRERADS